jgi:hypothetical protein
MTIEVTSVHDQDSLYEEVQDVRQALVAADNAATSREQAAYLRYAALSALLSDIKTAQATAATADSNAAAVLQQILAALADVQDRETKVQATLDQLSLVVAQILVLVGPGPTPVVTAGTISVNGVPSTQTGQNTFMAQAIKDNDPGAGVDVVWDDALGVVETLAQDAFAVGADTPLTTITQDATNPQHAVLVPGADRDASGVLLPITLTVTGTNADGTTVMITDLVPVVPSDAVTGSITVTPGN